MNPGDPRTLDPYRYADNNPVVFTDASGLAPDMCIPIGPHGYMDCRTIGERVFSGGGADDDIYGGAVDGVMDRGNAVAQPFTPKGAKQNWSDYQAAVADQGYWGAATSIVSGSVSAQEDELASIPQCAGSIMCLSSKSGRLNLGHAIGS